MTHTRKIIEGATCPTCGAGATHSCGPNAGEHRYAATHDPTHVSAMEDCIDALRRARPAHPAIVRLDELRKP